MIIRFESIDHQNSDTANPGVFRAFVTWVFLFSPAISLLQRHVLVSRVANYFSFGPYFHVIDLTHRQDISD